jgi:2-succinyl-5-enolpyruvyl-6-hydroxy-3-cyclohexene-1-carboxylate synthase
MYSDNKTIQILISLLKEFGVSQAVLSAGTRNVPFVHSVEKDDYFNCHSVVDERSAAYFAIGLALEYNEPVLISCTSGTASANYTSAICEAYEQHIPLVVLTSDRNQYFLGQLEDQQIPQSGMYRSRVKKSVTLPIVKDKKDEWYCQRLVNEALLEIDHNGGGPIHINIPTEWGLFAQNFTAKELPKLKPIKRISLRDMQRGKIDEVQELKQKKRILVLYSQHPKVANTVVYHIEGFTTKYSCVISVETISNLECRGTINTCLISRALDKQAFLEYAPDLVISLNGNYVSTIKGLLKGCTAEFDHWSVNEEGIIIDQFQRLSKVFECSMSDFFEYFNKSDNELLGKNEYYNFWQSKLNSLPEPDFKFSSNYVMQEFLCKIPNNSILHHGNGVAVHIAQYFHTDKSISSYCHSGTTTIDGSLSTFIGQASASDKLCFIFIGDLSFFYDMNAIWNRYVGKNVRILLYNNEGGETFHWNAAKEIDTLHLHTSAEHFTTAKGWVESRGFKYYEAKNEDEFNRLLPKFLVEESETPILFEVFTKKETDAKILLDYYEKCRIELENA